LFARARVRLGAVAREDAVLPLNRLIEPEEKTSVPVRAPAKNWEEICAQLGRACTGGSPQRRSDRETVRDVGAPRIIRATTYLKRDGSHLHLTVPRQAGTRKRYSPHRLSSRGAAGSLSSSHRLPLPPTLPWE